MEEPTGGCLWRAVIGRQKFQRYLSFQQALVSVIGYEAFQSHRES